MAERMGLPSRRPVERDSVGSNSTIHFTRYARGSLALLSNPVLGSNPSTTTRKKVQARKPKHFFWRRLQIGVQPKAIRV